MKKKTKPTVDAAPALTPASANTDAPAVKFEKPKILLVDVRDDVSESLEEAGYNVHRGTMGSPYRVAANSGFSPVIAAPKLPNFSEQEIVIIDLDVDLLDEPIGEKMHPDQESDYWCKNNFGFIDPRARSASMVRKAFDKIYASGGVFVVFAKAKVGVDLFIAKKDRYDRLELENEVKTDEWCFLTELTDMQVGAQHGDEMRVSSTDNPISRLLQPHLPNSGYECVLKAPWRQSNSWITLAVNKYNESVAEFRTNSGGGMVIVVPQLADKTAFVKALVVEVLPALAPILFPGIDEAKWIHLSEYELPEIVRLNERQQDLEAAFRAETAALETLARKAREMNGWLHDLLTQTGDPLVRAVKTGLSALGFESVIDMDEVRDREGKSRREDLQIQDRSPTLIVDIKGIANFPSDEDVLQADKHATLAMREQRRVDVFGLSLINHQRHIPPLDRDNAMPFRQELLSVAVERKIGLLTSWDFYRLVTNSVTLGWSFDSVAPILYEHGRIQIVPKHYIYIGSVVKVWTGYFGIDLVAELKVGDKVSIEFPIRFEECGVGSLMVDGKPVREAHVGDKTGIPWTEINKKLKVGQRVFRVGGQVLSG